MTYPALHLYIANSRVHPKEWADHCGFDFTKSFPRFYIVTFPGVMIKSGSSSQIFSKTVNAAIWFRSRCLRFIQIFRAVVCRTHWRNPQCNHLCGATDGGKPLWIGWNFNLPPCFIRMQSGCESIAWIRHRLGVRYVAFTMSRRHFGTACQNSCY